jgi:hypothetical protein
MGAHRPSDSLSTRTINTNHHEQVFPPGPWQNMARQLAWAEVRLKRVESDLKARVIAAAATDHMKLDEDKPL